MIKMFKDPFLQDYMYIASRMRADEASQIESLTGEKFSVDGAAVGCYMASGPKWVVKLADTEADFGTGDAIPLVAGGFTPQRPGVWRDWLITSPLAWDYAVAMTRICKKAMDAMLSSGQAHRLECVVPLARVESRPELVKWYKILGYEQEGIRRGYCADKSDAMAYFRTA